MNKTLSTLFNIIAKSIFIIGAILFVLYLLGYLHESPLGSFLELIQANVIADKNPKDIIGNALRPIVVPIMFFMEAASYIPLALMAGYFFQTLSKRYQFVSWEEMKAEVKNNSKHHLKK